MNPEEMYRLGVEFFMGEEQERARLTDILHNGVLQAFGAAMLKAELARKLMAVGRYAEVEKELEQLRTSLANTVDNLRDILFLLRPQPLQDRGLKPMLEELFERAKFRTNGEPSLSVDNLDGLPESAVSLAYRIVAHVVAVGRWVSPKAQIRGLTIHLIEGRSVLALDFVFLDEESAEEMFGPMYLYWGPRLGMFGGSLTRTERRDSLRFCFRLPAGLP